MTVVDLFAERVGDYMATVRRCTEGDLAGVLAELLSGTTTLAVPGDVPGGWLTRYSQMVLKDPEVNELDGPGVSVLTGCAVAIAETGTIILDAGVAQGKRALTLVPDHHVCVVRTEQVVPDVEDALAALPDPTRPLTLISGPSATSDIELNRVEGVHGPRRLDVVIVG
ncbi:MAG TPA: lactate utilization protein C [Micromonosporaceae bacterium]|nr:lactate utilization protein C [Micromonosporaceae bacterium]HCU50341.1 lactate utilization protein C [Micromonosporaceae bacterium]